MVLLLSNKVLVKEITATNSLIWVIDAAKHFFVDYSNEEYKKLFIEIVKFHFLKSSDNKLVVFIYLDEIIRNKKMHISFSEYLKLADKSTRMVN